jgi:hypothetical protein
MGIQVIGWEGVDRIHLGQDQDTVTCSSCEHVSELLGSKQGREFLD